MAIVIDEAFGDEDAVFDDLVQISRCDPGLTPGTNSSQSSGGGLAVGIPVYYYQKQVNTVSSNRLFAIIQAAQQVTIYGVASTFVFSDGVDIRSYGGGGTLQSSPIEVYYDVTEAAGEGYWVLDNKGAAICSPRQVILYHELAHAFDYIQKGSTSQEDAIQVENLFRQQLGLPLANVTNDTTGVGFNGGVEGFPRCDLPSKSWFFSQVCLVATAAAGSEHAPQVEALRQARTRYKDLSLWISLISAPALKAYSQFSPDVVRAMEAEPELKTAMLLYVVQPAFGFVRVVQAVLSAGADTPELATLLEDELRLFTSHIQASGQNTDTISLMAEAAAAAARHLRGEITLSNHGTVWPRDIYRYLAAVIATNGQAKPAFAWALDGVHVFLRAAASTLGANSRSASNVTEEIGSWVARLPLTDDAPLTMAVAQEELTVLKDKVFTRRDTQAQFADRLLAIWPGGDKDLLGLFNSIGFATRHD